MDSSLLLSATVIDATPIGLRRPSCLFAVIGEFNSHNNRKLVSGLRNPDRGKTHTAYVGSRCCVHDPSSRLQCDTMTNRVMDNLFGLACVCLCLHLCPATPYHHCSMNGTSSDAAAVFAYCGIVPKPYWVIAVKALSFTLLSFTADLLGKLRRFCRRKCCRNTTGAWSAVAPVTPSNLSTDKQLPQHHDGSPPADRGPGVAQVLTD